MTTKSQGDSSLEAPSAVRIEFHSGQNAWNEKMAELEAIHREIAPQVTAMREALEEDELESVLTEFDLAYFLRKRKGREERLVETL